MEKIKNINIIKKRIFTRLLAYALIGTTAFSTTACGKSDSTVYETTTDEKNDSLNKPTEDFIDDEITTEETESTMEETESATEETESTVEETESVTEETESTVEETESVTEEIQLSLNDFNKLVDSIITENEKVDFYLDRNYVETIAWALNKDISTDEVTNSILSNYSTEEEFINSLMVAIMEYGNDSNKYANGEKDTHADLNLLFASETSLSKVMPDILGKYYSTVETINDETLSSDIKNEQVSDYTSYLINFGLYNEYINGTSFNEIFGSEKLALVLTYTTQFTWLKTRNSAVNNYSNEVDLLENTYMNEMLSQIYSELDIEYKKCEEFQNSKQYTKEQ